VGVFVAEEHPEGNLTEKYFLSLSAWASYLELP
jgi:hypothetical protein